MAVRYSLADIAEYLNTSPWSLAAVLRELGLKAVGGKKIGPRRAAKIMRAYRLWCASKLGTAFGISRSLIRAAAIAPIVERKRERDKAVSAYTERDLENLSQRDE
jgi:hypothetical protein